MSQGGKKIKMDRTASRETGLPLYSHAHLLDVFDISLTEYDTPEMKHCYYGRVILGK